ncbi:MAG TPA: hypothetical protein VGB99_02965 [Acidobacteriota bacterium]
MTPILRSVREVLLGAALMALAWSFVATPLRTEAEGEPRWALADRLSYRFRDPRVGERVAFRQPDRPARIRIGRIAALPLVPVEDRSIPTAPAGHYGIELERAGSRPSRLIGPVPRLYVLGPIWPPGR